MSDFSSKEYLNSLNESSADRESVVNEGIQNLKNTIRSVKVEPPKPDKKGSDVTPMRKLDKLDIANQAINTYKERIKPAKDTAKDHVEDIKDNEKPVTKAQRVNAKELTRQLTGMRKHTTGSGDVGQPSRTTPNGNGNVGNPDASYAGLVSSMTLEQYQAHIFGSFGLTDDEPREEELVVEEQVDEDVVDVVAILEESLLALDSSDWIAVDKATRIVCSENNILPKELNSEFRRRNGSYPDKWIKEQAEVEYCGYFPLEEAARINKVGQLYHVTFAYRGGTQRFQFFWPEAGRPTHEEMQHAVEKFYPRARLLSYYLCPKQDHNGGLVLVPPMTESYEVLGESDWNVMSGYDQETLDLICEEEGEPLEPVELLEESGYVVIVEDHDDGHVKVITFANESDSRYQILPSEYAEAYIAEGKKKGLWDNIHAKRKRGEKKAKPGDKDYPETLDIEEGAAWTRKEGQNSAGGLNEKGRKSYERENPGSDLKRPQPEGGKRRDSYCARSKGQQDMHNIDCSKDPDKRICKARRKWNC